MFSPLQYKKNPDIKPKNAILSGSCHGAVIVLPVSAAIFHRHQRTKMPVQPPFLGSVREKLARDKAEIQARTQKLEEEGAEAKEEGALIREKRLEAFRELEEAEPQQREDVAAPKVHVDKLEAGRRTTRSDVVLGLVVAWQVVLTVGLVYVALAGQPAEQPADQATCPSPDE